ncbi:MAG: hypothetical protein H6744_01990 [Deltaproteobacteria bacterium]|nr:hypothetical protein [Deltaproteobacteria bacterium]MCB9785440.1 hypothetical protein [Deltaproteobacteria bacterium]
MAAGGEQAERARAEAVLTGDAGAAEALRGELVAAMRAAAVPAEVARAAAEAIAAVHARVRPGRPLTADHQRALDGAVEVGVTGVPALGPWVTRLRILTFDEPRLGRLSELVGGVARELEAPAPQR